MEMCEIINTCYVGGGQVHIAHTKLMCKYHIVFTSLQKYRRKIIYNQYKESIGDILKQLCAYTGVEIIKGHLMPDHIHM
jgi:putative transposase